MVPGTLDDLTLNAKIIYLDKSLLNKVVCIFLNLFEITEGSFILGPGSIILLTMLVTLACLGYTPEILLSICLRIVTVKIIACLITKQIEEIDWETYKRMIREKIKHSLSIVPLSNAKPPQKM